MKIHFTTKLLTALVAVIVAVSTTSAKNLKSADYTRGEIYEDKETGEVYKVVYPEYSPNHLFMAHEGDPRYSTRGKVLNANDARYKIMDCNYQFDKLSTEVDRQFLIKTNALYWIGTVMNLGFEYRPDTSKTLGFVLNGGYAPLYSKHWESNMGGWFISPEVRFYLGASKKWFIGAQYIHSDFDVKMDMFGDKGREGSLDGVGAVAGVKLPICKKVDVEVCVGLGAMNSNYNVYDVYPIAYAIDDTRYGRVVEESKSGWGFAPLQLGLNFGWNLIKR